MPINRYDIGNVYGLADPELYKSADKDDPEALLEGVSMAGLVGALRQLGDLAEFAAGIFHELHEDVMATAARGHGILVRVQQIETEIPSIERAFLSQTSHSAFFPNSGTDRHPNRQISHNHISTGDLPRFVMDSYEKCRGPPQLFLLDKFDVAGAGACLKRYSDSSVYNVEASSYESETAESQRDKKIHKVKLSSMEKKGSRWKEGETPEVSQPSHAKLHQLFVEEQVQTGATEPAHCVKLKTRPKKSPYDSGSGESYMIKLLNSPLEDKPSHEMPIHSSPLTLTSDTSNGSSLEIFEDSEVGPSLGSPMQNRSPGVSSSVEKTVCKDPPYILEKTAFEEEVDEKQMTVDEEIQINGLQNGYLSDDVASETDNYMDALTTMDSENETSINHGTYSDSNKDQLQSQISDSQSIENSTISDDGNSSIKKRITISLDNNTTSTAVENASPVGVDFPPRLFACIEIPFCSRVPPVAEKTPVTQNPDHDITNDTCIDMSKAPNVDQVATLGEDTLKEEDSNEVCSNHSEKLDSPRKSKERQIDKEVTVECISEHPDFLPTAGGVPSFSFVGNHKRDQDSKYPNDINITMIHVPNILETIKNQVEYAEENHSTGSDESQCSSPRVVNSRADEQPFGLILAERDIHDLEVDSSDTTFSDDISVAEEIPVEQLHEIVHGVSDPAEARVSYSSDHETESDNSEIEPVTVSDLSNANRSGCNGCSVLKEGTELEEIETESTYSDVNTNDGGKGLEDDTKLEGSEVDSVNTDMETSASVLVLVDIDKNENNSPVSEKSDYNHSVINQLCIEQDSKEAEKEEVDQFSVISPDDPNNDVNSIPYSTMSACDDLNKDVDGPSINSKILHARSHYFLAEIDQKQEGFLLDLVSHPVDIAPCDLLKLQLLYSATEATVFTESDSNFNQLHMQLPLATEGSPLLSKLGSLTQLDHETHIDTHFEDLQSSFESYSVPVSITKFLQSSRDDINISDQYEIAPCDPESNIFIEADHGLESKSMNHGDQIDIFEAPQSSPLEDKVNQPNCQLDVQLLLAITQLQDLQSPESYSVLVSEKNPTMEFMQASSHDINAFDQVKHQPNAVFSGFGKPPELAPVKLEHPSPLPPPPPIQWRVGNLQNSLLTLTDDAKHSDSHFPAFFKSTTNEGPQVVSYSTLDEIQSLDTENQISFSQRLLPKSTEDHDKSSVSSESKSDENLVPEEAVESIPTTSNREVFCPSINSDSLPLSTSEGPEVVSYSTIDKIQNFDKENQVSFSQLLLPECSVDTEDRDKSSVSSETKSDDNIVPQAAVESVAKSSDQEVFWPSSNPNPLPPIVVEMENNIHPMKIQRPHSPLIDAVTVLDKTKLRKVSDLATTQIPKGKERDTILDQIKAKSFKLKPAIQTWPSIQGPNTNLRLAAILEKAHAIRQAFVGSDDDDSDSSSDE